MNAPARVLIRKLNDQAQLPSRAHDSDAGWDVRSAETCVIEPGERRMVATGLAMALPDRWSCLVLARSGLAAKHGIMVANGPGLIDAGYRGEVKVILYNSGSEAFEISTGDLIAQLLFQPVFDIELEEAGQLDETERTGGFGSTGVG
jgi:dUTP pyrophosphatase